MNVSQLLLVGCGGAIGAILRYLLTLYLGQAHLFPWITLAINIAGSLAIGAIWGAHAQAEWFVDWGRALIVIGVLGGFTTFSAFSLETLHLINAQRLLAATAYAGTSVVGCLLAVAIGYRLST